MRISTYRISIILGAVLYVALLNWAYIYTITPVFSYMGYTYHHPVSTYIVLSWLIAILPSFWIPIALDRPSKIVYWIIYVLVLVPTAIIPFYTLSIDPVQISLFALAILVCFGLLGVIYHLPLWQIPRTRISGTAFWSLIIVAGTVFVAYIIATFGVPFRMIALTDVYGVRLESRDILAGTISFVAYALAWQSQVVNPLIISKGMVSKRFLLLAIGIIGQFMLFSITGEKSIFFSGLYIAALLLALQKGGRKFGPYIIWGTIGLIVVCVGTDIYLDQPFISSAFFRRMIITPGLLSGYYFEFFSKHPNAFLAHSILGPWIRYPYDVSPPFLIGQQYFGNVETSANANIWADAFANFGYVGILIFTLLLGAVLWLFDSMASKRDYRLTSLMLGISSMSLANGALLTSLFTHGIGLTLLIVYLMPEHANLGSRRKSSLVSLTKGFGYAESP